MRYEVPQFIEVEQKVIGPFTWKQFVYLAGGAGALLITFLLLPFLLFVLLGVPVAALAVLLAFQKVNNRPFEILLEAAFNYMVKARFYLWNIEEARKYTIIGNDTKAVEKEEAPQELAPRKEGGISSLETKLMEAETGTI
ncbi:hypothetical protein A3C89_04185 [Candidatus Kaiserbacteria bacterium RIFCSPHIGHO2_02_FULL_50_50]|uniref:PrgI family protein n=1 Tax=Candidatus Kaiserbacteria bacterium RIFCSPHIGHO2_02_FULL_50_50 TaxID=1798492 RepID=A0A1F6DGV6_9BACT|nr:MAG: hypothetical protein A3C89_04185 [Candidatus Kaiserbacteria bacterium RIFCSPHIGHO2_02_FULL_50_50]OGG88639.1 MAG: hypothetical protein A3G62_00910 [Candidatus Kaiserbacteria bacterium RIFCSPLOWO2_12_FULL_50_10]